MALSFNAGLRFHSEYVVNHLNCILEQKYEFNIIRTPSNPIFYFGNFLALKIPLYRFDLNKWQAIFRDSFQHEPRVKHFTFTWERNIGNTDSDHESNTSAIVKKFVAAGYEYEETHILTMNYDQFLQSNTNIKPLDKNIEFREISSESDWQQWQDVGVENQDGDHSEESFRTYLADNILNYKNLAKNNYGEYLGAFIDGKIIGYAGMYFLEGVARFQDVRVIEGHQNKGIAKQLLIQLINRQKQKHGAVQPIETYVIVADEHYHATKLYQSLGFKITERECSLCWWPKENRRT